MLDLEKIFRNPVNLIRLPYNVRNYVEIPQLLINKTKAKVFSMVNYNTKSDRLRFMESKNIFFVNFSDLKEILLEVLRKKESNVSFCSILIVNDIHISPLEKMLIINLWIEIYKISKVRPYLLITTVSKFIPELSFHMDSDKSQDLFGEDNRTLEYHNTSYAPNSLKIKEDILEIVVEMNRQDSKTENSFWLIFYPGKGDLAKELHNKIGKTVNIFSEKAIKNLNKTYASSKRSIIVVTSNFFTNVYIEKIDGIFDSMISNIDGNLSYSSKQNSEIRTSRSNKGFIYRFCTEEYYKDLPNINQRSFENKCIDKYYLEMMKENININFVFSNIVSDDKLNRDLDNLRIRGAIEGKKITEMGELITDLPLKSENCDLLYRWMQTKFPVFPALIACVLSELEEDILVKKNKKSNVFREYLIMFNEILKKETNFLEMDIDKIYMESNISPESMKNIRDKTLSCLTVLKKYLNSKNELEKLSIGTYNTDKLLKILKEYYEKSYFNETYTLIDKEKSLYKNKDQIYSLEREKFSYSNSSSPYKIVAFYKGRINEDQSSIQKGKKYIYYYSVI